MKPTTCGSRDRYLEPHLLAGHVVVVLYDLLKHRAMILVGVVHLVHLARPKQIRKLEGVKSISFKGVLRDPGAGLWMTHDDPSDSSLQDAVDPGGQLCSLEVHVHFSLDVLESLQHVRFARGELPVLKDDLVLVHRHLVKPAGSHVQPDIDFCRRPPYFLTSRYLTCGGVRFTFFVAAGPAF